MKHIFIDLEFCSCFRRSSPLACETIQFGAVALDEKLRFVGEFESFVSPDFATAIPSKERELTGITWEMVKDAPCFLDVCDDFIKWMNIEDGEDYLIYSWSDNDAIQLLRESRVKGHPMKEMGIFERWVDLQRCFMNTFNFKSQKSLEHALEIVELSFAGDAHKADVDAYNTARLYKFMLSLENVNLKIQKLSETRRNFTRAGEINPKEGNPRYHKFSKPKSLPKPMTMATPDKQQNPDAKRKRRRHRQHRG